MAESPGEPEAPELAPDVGHLVLSHGGAGQFLTNTLTGESCELEILPDSWRLLNDAEGKCFLRSGQEKPWAANMLEFPLYSGEAPQTYLVEQSEGVFTELSAWMGCLEGDRKFSMKVRSKAGCDFTVFVRQRPVKGACVWWSMTCVYENLEMAGRKTAGRWAASGWDRWLRFLVDRCGLEGHLINKAESGQKRDLDNRIGERVLSGDRSANYRMCSSQALVGLVSKWALAPQSDGGLDGQEGRETACYFLQSLFDVASPSGFKLFLDERVDSAGWPCGDNFIIITCSSSGVSLKGLMHKRHRVCTALCAKFSTAAQGIVEFISIADFLRGLFAERKSMELSLVLRQVIWWFGKALDMKVKGVVSVGSEGMLKNIDPYQVSKCLSQYWLALRETFANPSFLHMTLDQGTLGKKPTMCGMMALPNNKAALFPPQVMPSFVSDTTLAKAWAEPEQEAGDSSWQKKANSWLNKRKAEQEQEQERAPPKKMRKKAAAWLACVDQVLAKTCGEGIERYKVHGDMVYGTDPHSWPYIGITPDQGPDGFAAAYFAQYGKSLNVEMFYDISHGVWRDQEAAVRDVQLETFTHLMVIAYNLCHSPWNSEARFCALRESTEEYLETDMKGCPHYRSYRDAIVEELGISEELVGMNESEEFEAVKQHLKESWAHHKKGTQVKMCRFANWVDKAAEYDKGWSWMLLRLLHYALTEGMLEGVDLQALFKPVGSAEQNSDEQRIETNRGNDKLKRFRNALKSNVQVTLALLLEPSSRYKSRVLYVIVQPIRKWYGQQNAGIRSCSAFKQFLKRQVGNGEVNIPYRETLGLLCDGTVLQHLGLQTEFLEHHSTLDPDHPSIAEQDQIATLAVKYAFSLICSRFRRLQYLTHGWSGRQVNFLFEGKVQSTKLELFREHDTFRAAQSKPGAFWKKMTKRSYFHLVPTVQLLRLASDPSAEATDKLVAHVSQRLSGIGQSKISEDCMNRGRHLERTAANKQQQPPERLWAHLIDSNLVSGLYNYEQPKWQDAVALPGDRAVLPKAAYKVSLRQSPKWVGEIISTSRTTPWFSTSAPLSNTPYSDAFIMQRAMETGDWSNISQGCFLGQLAGGNGLALRRECTTEWYIGMGHQHGLLVIAWPCSQIVKNRQLIGFQMDLTASPHFLLVADLKWLAISVRWCSPASAVAMKRLSPKQASDQPTISCYVDGKPRPLMQEAVMHAFWDISGPYLKTICKYMDIKINNDDSEFDRIWALTEKVCPKMTPEQILQLLEARGRRQAQCDEMLMHEEAEELIDEQDREIFERYKGHTEQRQKVAAKYSEALAKKQASVRAARGSSSRSGEASSSSSAASPAVLYRSTTGKGIAIREFPTSSITQQEAQDLFPAPVRVYEDPVNGRWQAYWPGLCSRSRHFNLHGHVNGLRQLMQWAWRERLTRDLRPLKDCPIAGLFPEAESAN